MSDIVKLTRRGQVLEIQLDRPKANAIDNATTVELSKVFVSFRDDPELRVAIFTGTGRFFSAGWDLKAAAGGELDEVHVDGGFAGITEMFDLDKPVIAAVNGFAAGGGFEIALACDIIVASDNASMMLSEPRVGVVATGGGIIRLPRRLPRGIALGDALHRTSHRCAGSLSARSVEPFDHPGRSNGGGPRNCRSDRRMRPIVYRHHQVAAA